MDTNSLQAVIDRWSVGETDWTHQDITTLLAEVNRLRGALQSIADESYSDSAQIKARRALSANPSLSRDGRRDIAE